MEITRALNLTINEETLLDMHSVLNIMNVVVYELLMIAQHAGNPDLLNDEIATVSKTADLLKDTEKSANLISEISGFIETLRTSINRIPNSEKAPEYIKEARENLESIFSILVVRARELQARLDDPDIWLDYSVEQLQNNFQYVLLAIERNSHGHYHIVTNIAQYEENDYLIYFPIHSVEGDTIRMPAVFQDVMRDLLANARKYTPPGGIIEAGLFQSKEELRFVVRDTGAGIPEDEIESVIDFGTRGSNVADRPTRGGGFGLTKAYYVTRKFNGRMWIDSDGKTGTRIQIIIPLPS